ncbi:MAG: hypothetical protein GX318_08015 [Clostridia bacterium]|nr:hypothetical protein [Clostridia bacterium]
MSGYQFKDILSVKATAYDACELCCGKTDGITKSGRLARVNHTIAVDPDIIPLGTKIFIPQLGHLYTAEDIGGKIKGKTIDVYMADHEQAINFGVKELTIYILEETGSI